MRIESRTRLPKLPVLIPHVESHQLHWLHAWGCHLDRRRGRQMLLPLLRGSFAWFHCGDWVSVVPVKLDCTGNIREEEVSDD